MALLFFPGVFFEQHQAPALHNLAATGRGSEMTAIVRGRRGVRHGGMRLGHGQITNLFSFRVTLTTIGL